MPKSGRGGRENNLEQKLKAQNKKLKRENSQLRKQLRRFGQEEVLKNFTDPQKQSKSTRNCKNCINVEMQKMVLHGRDKTRTLWVCPSCGYRTKAQREKP